MRMICNHIACSTACWADPAAAAPKLFGQSTAMAHGYGEHLQRQAAAFWRGVRAWAKAAQAICRLERRPATGVRRFCLRALARRRLRRPEPKPDRLPEKCWANPRLSKTPPAPPTSCSICVLWHSRQTSNKVRQLLTPATAGNPISVALRVPCPALPCPALPCPALPCIAQRSGRNSFRSRRHQHRHRWLSLGSRRWSAIAGLGGTGFAGGQGPAPQAAEDRAPGAPPGRCWGPAHALPAAWATPLISSSSATWTPIGPAAPPPSPARDAVKACLAQASTHWWRHSCANWRCKAVCPSMRYSGCWGRPARRPPFTLTGGPARGAENRDGKLCQPWPADPPNRGLDGPTPAARLPGNDSSEGFQDPA